MKNAQEAGFSAAIIFDIAVGPLVMMAGDDPTIHIPSVFVSIDVGRTLLKAPNNTIATLTPDSFPEWQVNMHAPILASLRIPGLDLCTPLGPLFRKKVAYSKIVLRYGKRAWI